MAFGDKPKSGDRGETRVCPIPHSATREAWWKKETGACATTSRGMRQRPRFNSQKSFNCDVGGGTLKPGDPVCCLTTAREI